MKEKVETLLYRGSGVKSVRYALVGEIIEFDGVESGELSIEFYEDDKRSAQRALERDLQACRRTKLLIQIPRAGDIPLTKFAFSAFIVGWAAIGIDEGELIKIKAKVVTTMQFRQRANRWRGVAVQRDALKARHIALKAHELASG